MFRSTKILCLLFATAVLACHDTPLPFSPDDSPPLLSILDGAHSSGNQHFFFLPPMVPEPSYSGEFDKTLSPVVRICEWNGTACTGSLVTEFSMTTGPGSETVRVVPEDEHYIVNWHTNDFRLDAAKTYRIGVLVAGTELGHADVDVINSGKDIKKVDTREYVPLVIGRTLPIKFRLEEAAVFVVGPSGGTVIADDGNITLVVPEGALTSDVGITVVPSRAPLPDPRLIQGTFYDFGPDGTTFAQSVDLTIRYDPNAIPVGVQEASLRFHERVGDGWEKLPGSAVDASSNTVTGPVAGFSEISILGQTCVNPNELIGVWPVCSGSLSISQDYAEFDDPAVNNDRHHGGLDIAQPTETLVLVAASGLIVRIQKNDEGCTPPPEQVGDCSDHGYGNTVIVRHDMPDGTTYSQYSHLLRIDPTIESTCRGANTDPDVRRIFCEPPISVQAGQVIGEVGGSGFGIADAFPPHLHFEVKSFSTLGTDSDDATVGQAFGYTPAHPDEEHGQGRRYFDPLLILHQVSDITDIPVRLTAAGHGAALRVGPADYMYLASVATLGERHLQEGDEFLAVAWSAATEAPPCSSGWYRVVHGNQASALPAGLVVSTPRGPYFPEPTDGGSVPDAWVCAGDDGEAWVERLIWQLTSFSEAVAGEGSVSALAINENDHIFAAVSGGNVGTSGPGFFRSTDDGVSWVQINNGLTNTNADGITVASNSTVLAATHGDGVFRSTDNGDSFFPTNSSPLTSNGMYTFGESIYVLDGFSCTGLYRSRDDGVSWSTINNGLAMCVNGVAVNQAGHLFAATGTSGLFRSTNDGASWSAVNTGLACSNFSRIFVAPDGDIYAGSGLCGVYRSTDNGLTWTSVNDGLPTSGATLLGIGALGHVFVAPAGAPGVYHSADDGATWEPLNSGLGANAIGATIVFQSTGYAFVTDGLQIWRTTQPATTTNVAVTGGRGE